MNMLERNMQPIRAIREVYDVETIDKDGHRSPWGVGCRTLTEARGLAATRARAGGATIFELSFREDIKI